MFFSIAITVPEQEAEEYLDTARQITQENPHHSSIIEKDQESFSRPPPSPLSSHQGLINPVTSKLSPLLAREWLRRRVLEEKAKLLEDTIKKAERMVLALCRYGNE